ncbi:tetratricopeptide repeat protein 36 isoform X1 [Harpegnathos saltator]|uniref:tetratricopeptide repeat protein 36 isoform X1 n=1 Tax=Harpegnathos saltator TaxID=610380 RepID=UPI00058F79CC|nr:tetratricopeptide repeat protein 36 isoform X1 [Harpegnathos saltator]XP_025161956.1 tetratricopeptide repeat protein 36 isoform X1 [Harpegnathos saltator]
MEGLSEADRAVLTSIFDPLQPLGLSDFPEELETTGALEEDHLGPQVLDIVKRAIVCAEAKNFDESFRLFDEALKEAPKSPAILNDRAQAFRLANRHEEALKDLHLAVELSEGKGKVGVQALCQRGALYRWMEQEEKAKEDFVRAAKAGSSFARSQLVALNPYAAMCNAMLREIICKASYP